MDYEAFREPVGVESEIHLFGIYRVFIYGPHSIAFREEKVVSLFRVEMTSAASSTVSRVLSGILGPVLDPV